MKRLSFHGPSFEHFIMLGLGVNVLLFFKDGKMGLNKIVHILQDGRGTLLPGFLYQKPQAGFPSVFDDVDLGGVALAETSFLRMEISFIGFNTCILSICH